MHSRAGFTRVRDDCSFGSWYYEANDDSVAGPLVSHKYMNTCIGVCVHRCVCVCVCVCAFMYDLLFFIYIYIYRVQAFKQ